MDYSLQFYVFNIIIIGSFEYLDLPTGCFFPIHKPKQ